MPAVKKLWHKFLCAIGFHKLDFVYGNADTVISRSICKYCKERFRKDYD